jgi:succinate-semialdehyde dehydrogenase / glutarate-semialdehyde dehydrogenase
MYSQFGMFIDGAWRQGGTGELAPVLDPGTEQVLGEAPVAAKADVEEAIAAAQRGLKLWRSTAAWTRGDRLHAVADAMTSQAEAAARVLSLETGKPIAQARREWALATDQFRWYAEEARRIYGRIVESRAPGGRIEVTHEPVGIVAAFTAWNFPAALIARKVAPALAAGCSVVVRPSREVPGTAMMLFDCLRSGGIPAGVANLVLGPTDVTYRTLMDSALVRKVSLTGSTEVGKQMTRDAAPTMKRTSMELGGNAPMLVFEDAELDKALDLAVPTKFANAGQVCVTPDRFYVHESVHRPFIDGFVKRAKTLKLGHGLDESSQMGPLINARRREAVEAIVQDARDRGGRIETGGARPADKNAGFYFEPTVISGLPDEGKALAEENFGPIAAITPFSTAEEAYRRANSSEHGLSAYVFTRDLGRVREAVSVLEAGMVGVNSFALAAAEAPFGGIKESGMGREGGTEGILDYVNVKLAQITV